jgi:hypothetical protein
MRKIDSKFHAEYDEKFGRCLIVKTSNGDVVPDDEPLILFRARDRLAVRVLEFYRQISLEDGCNDFHFDLLDKRIEEFKKFAVDHSERMKQPSITRGK